MASQQQSPPKKKALQLSATTITSLDQDTLREIFLRLPSLPSLVRAALACRTFLDAVRSSPAFRRRFSALHRPPILGAFLSIQDTVVPSFVPLRRSNPDLAAAVSGAYFFLTRLPVPEEDNEKDKDALPDTRRPVPDEDKDKDALPNTRLPVPDEDKDKDALLDEDEDENAISEWSIEDCRDGFVLLHNWSTKQIAVYRLLTRAWISFPHRPTRPISFPRRQTRSTVAHHSFRIVCVCHNCLGARAIVLSSDTRKWQIFPWADVHGFWPQTGKVANGRIYWTIGMPSDARVLSTDTMQFSRIDMPPHRRGNELMKAGETKDGRLCMVCEPMGPVGPELSLVVWFWRADDDGVEKWMLDKSLPL
ncbi:hypothetical protein BRADI_1g05296v3 [Brachypodium distachyon]|uniref:F-box domain-containing protein n=1 Tax=Brachypodium distachyon TaxID=15368 RepID=A0A0Q3RHF4_BRADI|nr:hypothetical protein BRADI_1g05296v3 [Brachypodium distachyon]